MHSRVGRAVAVWAMAALWIVSWLTAPPAEAQTAAECGSRRAEDQALSERLDQVLAALNAMQQQLHDSQQRIEALQNELKSTEARLADLGSAPSDQAARALQAGVQQLQEEHAMVQAEVKQQEQTKVESASKYPLRLSGMLLFSAFRNAGAVDNIDQPAIAMPASSDEANGSLAASGRQTALGLQAFGPHLWGAKSSADLTLDFLGSSTTSEYTPAAGLLRLRTAHAMLEWPNSSLRLEVDKPLIAPLEPTSLLSFAQPALAWAGNLWIWTPQLVWSGDTAAAAGKFELQLGLIDSAAPSYASATGLRQPNAAEQSRTPGFESHISYILPLHRSSLELGAGGYYGRQSYEYGQHVDAWAATADFRLPLSTTVELSGALYRGRAINGLGGAFQDYLLSDDGVSGVDAAGGWSQIKWRIARWVEANAAIGQANGYASELEYAYPDTTDLYGNLARNRTILGDMIFRPNHYLVFSAEYRNLHSWPILGSVYASQAFGLGAGYLF
jgi:hypothetical protein